MTEKDITSKAEMNLEDLDMVTGGNEGSAENSGHETVITCYYCNKAITDEARRRDFRGKHFCSSNCYRDWRHKGLKIV